MQNLFFKTKTSNSAVYRPDERFNVYKGVNPERLTKAFNNIFLLYWECTPFSKDHPIPTILVSNNDDGTANFSYIDGKLEDPESVKGCSCWYTVDHDGMAHVKEFNEVLNLKNLPHMTAVVATIIQDVYGEFNLQKSGKQFLNKLIEESKSL